LRTKKEGEVSKPSAPLKDARYVNSIQVCLKKTPQATIQYAGVRQWL
jgi:hypothetical protein